MITIDSYWNNTSGAVNMLSSNFNIMDFIPIFAIFMSYIVCAWLLIIGLRRAFLNNNDNKKKMILIGGPANCKECQSSKYVMVITGRNEIFRNVYMIYKRDGNTSFAYPVLGKDLDNLFDKIQKKYNGNIPGIEL